MNTKVALADLEATFLRWDPADGPSQWREVDDFSLANGIMFLCPKCFLANAGPVGTHSVVCWSPDVPLPPDGPPPAPGRWRLEGASLADLSLVAGSSSVLLTSGCRWHGFVRDGSASVL